MAVEQAQKLKKEAEWNLKKLQMESGIDDEMLNAIQKERKIGQVDLQNKVTLEQNEQILFSQESQLHPCKYCERKFNKLALEKHEPVCHNVFGRKRAEFDSKMQRIGDFNPLQLLSNGTVPDSRNTSK